MLPSQFRRCWSVVNLDNLARNARTIKSLIGGQCQIMAVIKADAYGHGAELCARTLVGEGVRWLAVASLGEALSLRRSGIGCDILILGKVLPDMADTLCDNHLTTTVSSYGHASELSALCSPGKRVKVHIKLDTGMSRSGFLCDDTALVVNEVEKTCRLPNLNCEGIFTHFSCSDELDEGSTAFTQGQFDRFMDVIQKLAAKGIEFKYRHTANSAATLRFPQMHLDMVRPGLILYGLAPGEEQLPEGFTPAMELKAAIMMIKDIKKGASVSYGRTFIAPYDMKIAVVSIGYADGYRRALSNRARVLVNGHFADVIGRVCMDQTVIDISHCGHVSESDCVTLFGADENKYIGADELSDLCGTISYETVCLVGRRVPRLYIKDYAPCEIVDYLN